MKATVLAEDEQLIERALQVLLEELGPVEATRFLSLPRRKRLESVERHRRWQSGLDRDDFFDRVFG